MNISRFSQNVFLISLPGPCSLAAGTTHSEDKGVVVPCCWLDTQECESFTAHWEQQILLLEAVLWAYSEVEKHVSLLKPAAPLEKLPYPTDQQDNAHDEEKHAGAHVDPGTVA